MTVEEGVELCAMAAQAGTRVLFATPHVHAPWDSYPWSPGRSQRYAGAFPRVQA
jgi:hypothetical protein